MKEVEKLTIFLIILIFLLPSLLMDRLYPIDSTKNASIDGSDPLVLKDKGVFVYRDGYLNSMEVLHKSGKVLASMIPSRVEETFTGEISAYASLDPKAEEGECFSGDPSITASGEKVRRGIVAANFLPFGTKIRIPEYFGNEIFVVKDRMASSYGWGNIDIWMRDQEDAMEFGRVITKVEIIR